MSGHVSGISYNGFGDVVQDCEGDVTAQPDRLTSPVVTNPPAGTLDVTKVQVWVNPPTGGLGAHVVTACSDNSDGYLAMADTRLGGGMEKEFPKVVWPVGGSAEDFDQTWDYDLGVASQPDRWHFELTSSLSFSGVGQACPTSAATPIVLAKAVAQDNGQPLCPIIVWANAPDGNAHRITGPDAYPDLTVPLGGRVVLSASLCCGDIKGHSVEWTIGGKAVAGYSVDDPTGNQSTIKVLDKHPTTEAVSFYWYAGTSGPVTLSVDGKRVSATFKIRHPTAALTATTCGVGMIPADVLHGGMPLPAFGLGLNENCKSTPGISWSGSALDGDPGWLGMIQLYLDGLSKNGKACPITNEGAGFATDNQTFYGKTDGGPGTPPAPGLVVSATSPWTDSDSPAYHVTGLTDSFSRSFVAQDYFMYKSGDRNSAESIWVPLLRLDWHWSATATASLGSWSITASQNPATSPPAVLWSQLPQWTWVDTNANYFACP